MPSEIPVPFWLRRLSLLVHGVAADRERPDLIELGRIDDPEDFVWQILPHAARTFAACIALMPRRAALPSAVAYLYCRMLDTYEDLVPDAAERDAALQQFGARLSKTGHSVGSAPVISRASDLDARDRAHLLLVERAALVDRVFLAFDEGTRAIIRDLVSDMARGMRWSSATFARQGGVLTSDSQLSEYCGHVLGNPTVFGMRILRLCYGGRTTLTAAERRDAMSVGEFVQLANVTRDIEKDLSRGIAYDPSLRADLGRNARDDAPDAAFLERCRAVREKLLRRAASLSPAYARVIDAIGLPPVSVARAAAVLMVLFTEHYYLSCAAIAGVLPPQPTASPSTLILRSLMTTFLPVAGRRELARAENRLGQLSS